MLRYTGDKSKGKFKMSGEKKRVVIKIGTAVLSRGVGIGSLENLSRLAREVSALRAQGLEIILVTSGAIGAGVEKLGWNGKPRDLRKKQAAAALGQVSLMESYQKIFAVHDTLVAQVLLTRGDFDDRKRYLNARNTLLSLLEMDVLPIINENDTVAVEEIQFGDNDKLSALVAAKIDADLLVILSDVEGLYRSEPGSSPEVVPIVTEITPVIERHAWKGSSGGLGTGGMASKIEAAKIATASGVTVVVASGFAPGVLSDIMEGRSAGTKFISSKSIPAKEKWILFGAVPKGEIVVDSGAVKALRELKRSLLPAGILSVRGIFHRGEVVRIKTDGDEEFARGITSYSSVEIEKIMGKKTTEIKKTLSASSASARGKGARSETSTPRAEVIHRDSLALIP